MRLTEGKTYKDYYVVIEIDGVLRNIRKSSGSTKLGYTDANNILIFEKKKEATAWIEKNSYKGMSKKYEVAKITNSKETNYRWELLNMARKHENFNYNYGWKTAPEQWSFYYNEKYIPLDSDTRNRLACMCLSGKVKEAEDELKRLLRKEEKQKHDYITFGFYGKDSTEFYYTKQLLAHRSDFAEKLRIYKEWKRHIIEDCKGRLQPFTVTTGYITPYGVSKAEEEDTSVLIDTDRRGIVIRFVENPENRLFRV